MDTQDFLKDVIMMYGKTKQTIVAIEEMSELTKELTKSMRGLGRHAGIVEEMADVLICMAELQIMYKVSDDELQAMTDKKMKRLKQRIEGVVENESV